MLFYILIFTLIGSIFSLVGSFFLLIKRDITESFSNQLVNFAAGVLIAVAFLDLLPEASELIGGSNIFLPVLLGFISFFFAERFIQWFHYYHGHGQKSNILFILVGDGAHNFIDGTAMAARLL